MRERQHLESAIAAVRETERDLDDNLGLIELGEAEGDEGVVADAEAAIAELARHAARRQVETLLSGEADGNDTYLEIHAGAGGTESQDWAQMLFRMYTRWAERSGYKVETLEYHDGEEAGMKSATILIKGENAYGWLKTGVRRAPAGAHLAVRQRGAAAYQLCQRLGLSGGRRVH
jgi:peptide chain release factor 2